MRICLTVPERFAAQKELPAVLKGEAGGTREPVGLYVLPEGFLRSPEDLELALELTKELSATVVAGYRDGDYERALVIESGGITSQYTKCILTGGERAKGKRAGGEIHCLKSRLGKLAVPICYELHFPEVCRIMALESPVLMINPIGTGMYHRLQYNQWRALARARAIENEAPVVGCCHFCGEIPLAFAFSSAGESLLEVENRHGGFYLEMDLRPQKAIGYFPDRRPELFEKLAK